MQWLVSQRPCAAAERGGSGGAGGVRLTTMAAAAERGGVARRADTSGHAPAADAAVPQRGRRARSGRSSTQVCRWTSGRRGRDAEAQLEAGWAGAGRCARCACGSVRVRAREEAAPNRGRRAKQRQTRTCSSEKEEKKTSEGDGRVVQWIVTMQRGGQEGSQPQAGSVGVADAGWRRVGGRAVLLNVSSAWGLCRMHVSTSQRRARPMTSPLLDG